MTAPGDTAVGRPLRFALRSAVVLVWSAARREFAVMAASQAITAGAVMAQLFLARELLTEITDESSDLTFRSALPVLVALAAVRVANGVAGELRNEIRRVAHVRVSALAAEQLYSAATAAELAAFDDSEFLDRLWRAHRNVDRRIWTTVWSLVSITTALTTVGALAVIVAAVAPMVLVFAAAAAAPLWWVRRKNNEANYRFAYERTEEDRQRRSLERLTASREGAAEIRALELGPTLVERIGELYDDRLQRTRHLVRSRLAWSTGAAVMSSIIAVGSVAVLVALIADGQLSVADGAIAVLALQQAAGRLANVSESLGALGGAALFLDDYERFIRNAEPTCDARSESSEAASTVVQRISMSDVWFTYPGMLEPSLQGVSLHVSRGETIALVGLNGSGKTTIAKLLNGLYPHDRGTITWSTADGDALDRDAVRRLVSTAFQDQLRFELSARDNVAFGDVRRSDDVDATAWTALRAAGIDEVIARHPDGLDGRLGRSFSEGHELSGGQWQRLGLARAFYRDAPVVILDEPTAAIDAEAEAELFETIRQLRSERAVVLISHRMATVKDVDRIYVIDQGEVVESGTHEELMAADQRYRRMFSAQADPYQ